MKLKATITTTMEVANIPEAAEAYNKFLTYIKELESKTGHKFELDMRETREVLRRKRGE